MDRYNVTSPLNIDPEQIILPEPKAAKYSGIAAGKETKILNSHGKLVSKWGRYIKLFFNKVFFKKKMKQEPQCMHSRNI
ncbi:hypothetical protein [Endozoicomonas sp. ONNA2]|uniref:hypothetical protein n=1 Tax=Endozoicomonas sp. ONNA2 TaxID=2828741 RepID=UPI002147AB74|nr:hypothetical protein [Endozoicomonas sp. ONNA2]